MLFFVGASIVLGTAGAERAVCQDNRPVSIQGRVQDAFGGPVVGARLTARNLGSEADSSATSDAQGRYHLDLPTPGAYEIVAGKYGFSEAAARIGIAAGEQAVADFTLPLASADRIEMAGGAKSLEAVEARMEELEAQLKKLTAERATRETQPAEAASSLAEAASHEERSTLVASLMKSSDQFPILPATLSPDRSKAVAANVAAIDAAQQSVLAGSSSGQSQAPAPAAPPPAVDLQTPFAFADFTWLNGQPRNKDEVVDTPFFTPEVRFDTHYMEDFNQPVDHTMGGTTESFRSGEFQVEQASVGGDFHWQNVRGRILTMFGLFASTTARNDASTAVGQWDLRTAYRYISEAYGGYHFDVNHGLNVDAGIFVSYVGLFSYYNFDNWTYQPSFVSSNTPWFFNGLRIQWFPTNKLKIEPWIVNGWQSYARFNGRHGFGGQILWQPAEWFKLVLNNYGNGTDSLGAPGRSRFHTDNSIEVRYFNKPESTGISKMAFTVTGDAGCEYGGGVTCHGGKGGPKQAFLGWMAYNRIWWDRDLFAITMGGGMMNNPGRFLTLLPPINGADAISGSPYFTLNPGDKAHMWDSTVTFNWMPKQYLTWWVEGGYRHSDVPYWSGRGGITPPGGNNGAPQYYTCMSGASAGTAVLADAQSACGGAGSVWFPDLRKGEATVSAGVMVKF